MIDVRVKLEQSENIQKSENRMILSQVQARELGEALLDAAEATKTSKQDQAIVIINTAAVAVPFNSDTQDLYETPVIVKV